MLRGPNGPLQPLPSWSLPAFLHRETQVGCSPRCNCCPATPTAAFQHSCLATCQAALTLSLEQRATRKQGLALSITAETLRLHRKPGSDTSLGDRRLSRPHQASPRPLPPFLTHLQTAPLPRYGHNPSSAETKPRSNALSHAQPTFQNDHCVHTHTRATLASRCSSEEYSLP